MNVQKQTQQKNDPHLADVLEKRAGRILEACAQHGDGRESGLGNVLAMGLMEVVAMLRGRAAGGARDGAELSVGSIVAGFARLRGACAGAIADELGREPSSAEILTIDEAIDAALLGRTEAMESARAEAGELESRQWGLYLSILSHDLRGSLNGVVLMLEVIRRDLERAGASAELMEDVRLMKSSVLGAVGTVERHAYLEKLRRGSVEVESRMASLRQVADQALTKVSAEAMERGVRFVNEISEDAVVRSDGEMIGRALREMLENAGQFASPGEVTMWAGRAELDGKPAWILNVRDQGPGIERERLEKLIDPVKRLELKDRGLGLVIAAYIAQRLGGKLEGESTPRGGTTFRLIVPDRPE